MSIKLTNISVSSEMRMTNTNGTDETFDFVLDLSKTGEGSVGSGFGSTYFFGLPSGTVTGGGAGGFKSIFTFSKWNGTAFTTATEETALVSLDKFESETQYFYCADMSKTNATNSRDGYLTAVEVVFVPASGSNVTVFSSSSPTKSTMSETIQTGQTLKGIPVLNFDGTNDVLILKNKFSIVLDK